MTGRFDRNFLPAIDDFCARAGLTWRSGRGREQRWDCPLAEHSHRGNLAVNVDKGVWQCLGGCGAGDVVELHQRITGLGFVDAARDLGAMLGDDAPTPDRPAPPPRRVPVDDEAEAERAARKRHRAAEVWASARPIEAGTPAHAYLVGRGCVIPPTDGDLRWMPRFVMARLDGPPLDGPVLVGRISRVRDARAGIGVHLTWLERSDDRWHRTERRYQGAKADGVVRLWPDESVEAGLAVAEGVETALAAAHAFRPVWACMDAGNLAAFPLLPGVEALTVFADNDASGTGQAKADEVAQRWAEADCEVRVVLADEVGQDIADEVCA